MPCGHSMWTFLVILLLVALLPVDLAPHFGFFFPLVVLSLERVFSSYSTVYLTLLFTVPIYAIAFVQLGL